ncbi:coiled-coil domain-containing protein 47-like [Patiria miniata]|uniref:PAT complex subunit CCDC47 n=1 Tax=Patiria miniata TaxID=46514 RepID=A0A913YYJ0_PATMI|nr:coiled-coil domain-containing protein 47-like [Patiria miniata]XP_038044629.1 coiled-coil domain-containing protein 47-like [Patiria miniata]
MSRSSLLLLALCGLLLAPLVLGAAGNHRGADIEDNEFAEFEDLGDEEEDDGTVETEGDGDDFDDVVEAEGPFEGDFDEEEDGVVEDEDEFEHFHDTEEFENFEKEKPFKGKGSSDTPDLEIAKLPMHLRNNWDSYYMEILMIVGILAYVLNYVTGKSKNQKLSTAWLNSHLELLESNFALVGDDGSQKDPPVTGQLLKESESRYCLWCSGRSCCEGMLVELKLLKRQDLVSVVAKLMKPGSDEILITVTMNSEDMDSFILFAGRKKIASKMQKDMQDLSQYCQDKRSGEKYGLPSSSVVFAESAEVIQGVVDGKISSCLGQYEDMFEYLHFSDQFSGLKPNADDEQPSKMPDTKKVLIFCFKVPGGARCTKVDMESMLPMMKMVLYCIEKVKRYKLSREAKLKADKARAKVSESFVKLAHAQRQEAAQQRREEKRRVEKDRLLNEEDPEKARKLEEKQYRKDMRKRLNPGMKQMKVRVT